MRGLPRLAQLAGPALSLPRAQPWLRRGPHPGSLPGSKAIRSSGAQKQAELFGGDLRPINLNNQSTAEPRYGNDLVSKSQTCGGDFL